jgi:hypothetical protein
MTVADDLRTALAKRLLYAADHIETVDMTRRSVRRMFEKQLRDAAAALAPSVEAGKPKAWTPPAHCSRCIDCDGTGLYPSSARCKSCLGTGLVDADDGESLFASPPPVAEGMDD